VKIKTSIWLVLLRPSDGHIGVEGVLTLPEAIAPAFDMRLRYNPDIHLSTMRLPRGTRRDQVYDALDQLSEDELRRLYDLPPHPLVDHATPGIYRAEPIGEGIGWNKGWIT